MGETARITMECVAFYIPLQPSSPRWLEFAPAFGRVFFWGGYQAWGKGEAAPN